MLKFAESSIDFSIITNSNGKLSVRCDGARKEKDPVEVHEKVTERSPSPCSSLNSSVCSRNSDSSVSSELPLIAGARRRVLSSSLQSEDGSESVFSSDVSLPRVKSISELSDSSFISCVSSISSMSIRTFPSHETLIADDYSDEQIEDVVRQRESTKKRVAETRIEPKPEKKLATHTQTPPTFKPKEDRFGGYSQEELERSWRKTQEKMCRPSISPTYPPRKNSPKTETSITNSNRSFTRIPSLLNRPPTQPRPLIPSRPVPGSYASAIRSPVSALAPLPVTEQTVKLTISTDTNGKMRLNFSKGMTLEVFTIDGIVGESDNIEIHKEIDGKNNNH
ncbi:unnamed protein product [Caenorhabditis sp. 36 PRJEB53466]|nr:unnamed protein product [Caenorhabditis sp. 36 PRJEB53466]